MEIEFESADDYELNDDVDDITFYVPIEDEKYKIETKTFNSKEDLQEEIKDRIDRICEFTSLSDTAACKLLIEYNWNVDKALETFLQEENIDEEIENQIEIEIQVNSFDCTICIQNINQQEAVKFSCEHEICKKCCESYLWTKLNDNSYQNSNKIECPNFNCNSMTCIKNICVNLIDGKTIDESLEIIQRLFVITNSHIKICPKCKKVIHIDVLLNDQYGGLEITCECNYSFCSSCSLPWHELINCELYQKYKTLNETCMKLISNKVNEDMLEWLKNKTKTCPNCGEVIEKNAGCNHMKCIRCNHDFCWICLGNFNRSHICDIKSKEHQISKEKLEKFYLLLKSENIELVTDNLPEILKYTYKDGVNRYAFHTKKIEKEAEEFAYVTQYNKLYRFKCLLKECRILLCDAYIFSIFVEQTDSARLIEMHRIFLELQTDRLRFIFDKNGSYLTSLDICEKLCRNLKSGVKEGIFVFKDNLY